MAERQPEMNEAKRWTEIFRQLALIFTKKAGGCRSATAATEQYFKSQAKLKTKVKVISLDIISIAETKHDSQILPKKMRLEISMHCELKIRF